MSLAPSPSINTNLSPKSKQKKAEGIAKAASLETAGQKAAQTPEKKIKKKKKNKKRSYKKIMQEIMGKQRTDAEAKRHHKQWLDKTMPRISSSKVDKI